jgi:hypothetical protein
MKKFFRKPEPHDDERLLVKELIQGLVLGFLLGVLTAFLILA